MRELFLLLGLLVFVASFSEKPKPKDKTLSPEQDAALKRFLDSPAAAVGDRDRVQKALKLLKNASSKEIANFYGELRYRTADWVSEFGKPQIAPIFEDIAKLHYAKSNPEQSEALIAKQVHEDFEFLCKR